jgi:hypothetical protein
LAPKQERFEKDKYQVHDIVENSMKVADVRDIDSENPNEQFLRRSTTWKDISNCMFFITEGQHITIML